jgi:hypothetical protein
VATGGHSDHARRSVWRMFGLTTGALVTVRSSGAYERASRHEQAPADARPMFERALADERRHREWMETTVQQL